MKILIRLPNWLGDVVMSTAFIAGVRQFYPDAGAYGYCDRLDGVCAVAGARANAPEHRVDRTSPTTTVFAVGHRYR